jgi:hypothetical protein
MLSARIAEQLRVRDHDVRAIDEDRELRGLSDPDVFAHAQQEGCAIVTYNREDFLALDREYASRRREHHGIVILHPRRFPQGEQSVGALVRSLSSLIAEGPPYPSFTHWLQ